MLRNFSRNDTNFWRLFSPERTSTWHHLNVHGDYSQWAHKTSHIWMGAESALNACSWHLFASSMDMGIPHLAHEIWCKRRWSGKRVQDLMRRLQDQNPFAALPSYYSCFDQREEYWDWKRWQWLLLYKRPERYFQNLLRYVWNDTFELNPATLAKSAWSFAWNFLVVLKSTLLNDHKWYFSIQWVLNCS